MKSEKCCECLKKNECTDDLICPDDVPHGASSEDQDDAYGGSGDIPYDNNDFSKIWRIENQLFKPPKDIPPVRIKKGE